MNESQATAALRKLFGKKAWWRYREEAPMAEERDRFGSLLPALRQTHSEARAAADARRMELLKADDEYQRLIFTARAAEHACDQARGVVLSFRVTVGRFIGIGNEIMGEGDTWQEAVDKARAKVSS